MQYLAQNRVLTFGKYWGNVKLLQNYLGLGRELRREGEYLKITESSFEGEGKERKYNSFLLWPENIVDFQKNLTEISNYMAQ